LSVFVKVKPYFKPEIIKTNTYHTQLITLCLLPAALRAAQAASI